MRELATEIRSLDQIAALLNSQQSCCLGLADSAPLPFVNGVIAVVHDLRNLLFPGIHVPEGARPLVSTSNIRLQLLPIHTRLKREIARALEHSRQARLRIHRSGTDALTGTPNDPSSATSITDSFLSRLPELQTILASDVAAAFNRRTA